MMECLRHPCAMLDGLQALDIFDAGLGEVRFLQRIGFQVEEFQFGGRGSAFGVFRCAGNEKLGPAIDHDLGDEALGRCFEVVDVVGVALDEDGFPRDP
jgi:hypothetical protein